MKTGYNKRIKILKNWPHNSLLVLVDGRQMAEYPMEVKPHSKARAIRKAIRTHLENGGTAGNYQW